MRKTRLSRWTACIASCLAFSALASGFAATASADKSDCPAQYFCLWDGPTFGERRVQFHDNGWQNLADYGFNDMASSAYNNTNRIATIAENINGGGKKYCIDPGGAVTLSGGPFNNIASSVYLSPSSCG